MVTRKGRRVDVSMGVVVCQHIANPDPTSFSQRWSPKKKKRRKEKKRKATSKTRGKRGERVRGEENR